MQGTEKIGPLFNNPDTRRAAYISEKAAVEAARLVETAIRSRLRKQDLILTLPEFDSFIRNTEVEGVRESLVQTQEMLVLGISIKEKIKRGKTSRFDALLQLLDGFDKRLADRISPERLKTLSEQRYKRIESSLEEESFE